MARIYATTTQYAEWAGDGATTTDSLLRAASSIIDEALIGAIYATDDDGKPTVTKVATTIRDATCAQTQWMDAIGDTSGVGDVAEVDSASIGSVSFSGGRTSSTTLKSGRTLAGTAAAILRVDGLLQPGVFTRG